MSTQSLSTLSNLRTLEKPQSSEQKIKFLKKYDFFVLIDKSGSMQTEDDGESRWTIVREELKQIVSAAVELDPDGIDVCFFGTKTEWHENVESEAQVDRLFSKVQPGGVTRLDNALEEAFAKHRSMRKEKKLHKKIQKSIVLVITDGVPYDGTSTAICKLRVIDKITRITRHLSKKHLFQIQDRKTQKPVVKTTELGVRFFQVGNDKSASEFLEQLDDDLEKAKADIVDTGDIEELSSPASVREAFINAIFD